MVNPRSAQEHLVSKSTEGILPVIDSELVTSAFEQAQRVGAKYALVGGNVDVPAEDERMDVFLEAFGAVMDDNPVTSVKQMRERVSKCSTLTGNVDEQVQRVYGDATDIRSGSGDLLAIVVGTNDSDYKLMFEGAGIRTEGQTVSVTVLAAVR